MMFPDKGPWFHTKKLRWESRRSMPEVPFVKRARWLTTFLMNLAKHLDIRMPVVYRLPQSHTIHYWLNCLPVQVNKHRASAPDDWLREWKPVFTTSKQLKLIAWHCVFRPLLQRPGLRAAVTKTRVGKAEKWWNPHESPYIAIQIQLYRQAGQEADADPGGSKSGSVTGMHWGCDPYGFLLGIVYPVYPQTIMTMMTIWKITSFNRSINYKWPFSIAMLNLPEESCFFSGVFVDLFGWLGCAQVYPRIGDLGRSASGDPELYQIESQVPRP
jgi:hypothetical protein